MWLRVKRLLETEPARVARRQKHNEIEHRRRERVNDHFAEVDSICITADPSKGFVKRDRDMILVNAIALFKEWRAELDTLRAEKKAGLFGPSRDMGVAGSPNSDGASVTSTNGLNGCSAPAIVSMAPGNMPPFAQQFGMWVLRLDGSIQMVNDAALRMFGYSRDEFAPPRTKSCLALTHPDDLPGSFDALHQLLSGKRKSVLCSKRIQHRDGHWVHINLLATSELDSRGEVSGYQCVFLDDLQRAPPPLLDPRLLPAMNYITSTAGGSVSLPTAQFGR